MRDRLTELVDKAKEEYINDVTDHNETDYIVECLLNNGVILPPCKVGGTVYSVVFNKIQAFVVVVCNIQLVGGEASFEYKAQNAEYPMYFSGSNIGKRVFLTKEEAKKALKEKEK